jgi:hypothetical protein
MGAGKSKTIIDDYLEGSLAAEYQRGAVDLFKHYTETRCGDYIKSRAYEDKMFPCQMVDDGVDFFRGRKKYLIVEEFHAFVPETIERLLAGLKPNGVELLVLSGLKYYASGDIWPTYSIVEDLCRSRGIDFEEKIAFYGKCEYPDCANYAVNHKLNPANEEKLRLGLFVFSQARLQDYQFFCEECFQRLNGFRDSNLYLTQHTSDSRSS